MSVKKRGLGRGLSDLGLNELLKRMTTETYESVVTEADKSDTSQFKELHVSELHPGKYQPRKEMVNQALEELAESIRSQGIIQPIVVRKVADQQYEIVAGERRWRAAQIAGLEHVPVIIREIPDNAAIAMALIENIQRENLNAIEEATALQRLSQEFSLTHGEVAKIVGKSRATITNLLRLLSLCPQIKQMVESGELEMGHARALLSLDEDRQIQIAKQVVLKKLSVRDTELYIRRLLNLSDMPTQKPKDVTISRIEKDLTKRLGTKVTIKSRDEERGKLILHYQTKEQLDTILNHFEK